MSSVLYPVGPEPPGVYWRRRAAILLVLLLILALVWWFFGRGGGDGAEPAASASATATAEPSETPTEPTPTTEPSESPSASDSASSGEAGACADDVIEVDASTDASSYPAGSTPKLTLKITNGGSEACERDVGPKANELIITSGGYHVWSSDDCNPSDTVDVRTLEAGESVSVTVTWDGRLSAEGCPANQPAAKPGGYDLEGRNGDVVSEKQAFALT
ncbi:MAG: hypothetical protein R2737_16845 [Candidatus Nanopelagicales bacterium]